ncbi:MAG TPA: HlyD family efflux transporter periplasmic adaptor subunit [Thermoanaerobaculia bacterium]|nr:HlyD family efflux transporter periplasmic adaptor subunit [Thermoanaerobaculia bacterium]
MKRWLAGSLFAALLAALAFGGAFFRPGRAPVVPTLVVRKATLARTVRAEGVLKAVEATPVRVPGNDVSLKIGWMIEDGSPVKEGDVVVRLDPSATVKLLAEGLAELATAGHRGEKDRVESGAIVANLGRDAVQARRERTTAETFQSRDPELFSRQEIIEADIDVGLATQKERHAVGSRSEREGLARTSRDLVALDGRKAHLKIDKAERELAALELKAPHDGIVVLKRNWRGDLPQVGQVVWSSQTLAEIPDLALLEAEVWVLEADAGGLAPGRPATVSLEAHAGAPVPASVKSVDALARPRLRNVPIQYFGAVLSLSSTDPTRMKPGERVAATLDLGGVKDALVVPRHAVFERNGKAVVFRRSRGAFLQVPVTLGAAALGRVAITSGLAEGDVIALVDPEESPAAAPSPAPGSPVGGAS